MSERYTCEKREAAVKAKNRPGPAGQVNITPVITAVDFGETLASLSLGFRIFWIEIDT